LVLWLSKGYLIVEILDCSVLPCFTCTGRPIKTHAHEQEGNCSACKKEINDDMEKYFNQFSGKYIGSIHKNCKPKYKLSDRSENDK